MVTTSLETLPVHVGNLLDSVELLRVEAARHLDDERRAARGQYFTPSGVAQLMATMFTWDEPHLRLLDAGAGVGSFTRYSKAC